VNRYLMARHDIFSLDPAFAAEYRDHGRFGRSNGGLKILNWATKFVVDALLLRKHVQEPGFRK
jgi:hypothetical protein